MCHVEKTVDVFFFFFLGNISGQVWLVCVWEYLMLCFFLLLICVLVWKEFDVVLAVGPQHYCVAEASPSVTSSTEP